MGRMIGEHFKQDGTPKKTYRTPAAGQQAAKLHKQVMYRCSFCNLYHLAKPR